MLIALMRHGEAESTAKTGRDFDRALSQNGFKHAETIGKILLKKAIFPKNVMCSPALRTRQTLAALHLGKNTQLNFQNQLYYGSVRDYLTVTVNAERNGFPLLVIGHNPAISLIMSELCGFDGTPVLVNFLKPVNLALIDVPEESKQQLIGKGHLIHVVTP
ncbi:histidine phosphatase family protein [uncultured Bartonella sp.]|uniref:SixA phosphatase family protein n=1 Tax=uncultured Bartonella sp. TaxID=104108 RepID=UPI0025D569FD|nr:histidine phosphatase family protein [uncultured Bartonella sp.]